MGQIKYYHLKSSHLYQEDDVVEKQLYERTFTVKIVREYETIFYDPNLKTNFLDESKSGYLIEIELDNFQLHVCRRMKQAEDFLRRINYLFDHVVLKVNKKGKILSIENVEELRKEWEKLKLFLMSDYSGIEVEDYLKEIDAWFETVQGMADQIFSFFHYGLAFPFIPLKHSDDRYIQRRVRLSEYEPDKFEQQTNYVKEENLCRYYTVSGKVPSESKMEIFKYEGEIEVPVNELLTQCAEVEVEFLYQSGINCWQFILSQIDNNDDESEDDESEEFETTE